MKTRPLGKEGFSVSEIGLGCWQLGGDFGPLEERTAGEILQAAVDSGITFFDTANVYGAGRSESLIGQFLKTTDQPIRVATKYGRGDVYPDGYTLDSMRKSVDDSRSRLGVERIDLLQLHCVPITILKQGEIFDWLRTLQSEGAIEHFGASVESDEQAMICLEQAGLLSLQVIFNVLRQKPMIEVLPKAEELGVGIIVRLPLASGLLSGKFQANQQFAESDHRTFNRDGQHFNVGETFAGLRFDAGVKLVDSIRPHVPSGMSMAEMAQRWILDQPAVSTVITGATSATQVCENARAAELEPLSQEVHEALTSFYWNDVHEQIRGVY